ncbi:MAG: PQQ-binding-like beta-propeller repeat protein [Pseudomonadales bacterium]|nr:PQQ-binding-like beta-propeller repeat protein [Pseudomonadales bacterium]
MTRCVLAVCLVIAATDALSWEHYGNDEGGSKWSELDQINPSNVHNLQSAWTYHTGDTGDEFRGNSLSFQATPVLWDGKLFFNSSHGFAYAIDASTGKELWKYDGGMSRDHYFAESAARGVTLWHAKGSGAADGACSHRVIYGDLSGNIHALDARSGLPCDDFANGGVLNLREIEGVADIGDFTITSPPALYGDSLIFGSAIGDNRRVDSERGIVRAIDARSGDTLWTWDPIPRNDDDPAASSWSAESRAITGGANAWAPLSVDSDLGLVYVPASSPSVDFYGGNRPGNNNYANSVVALNAKSGQLVWHQQLIHHDVWDYDTPAQPVLVDLELGSTPVRALVQVTKTGMMYVLDRRTGAPLIPIDERAVPQHGVPGERLSATQPFSTLPPLANHEPITEEDAFGIMYFDKLGCQQRISRHRSEGIFTPPTTEGSILRPGYAGGINWGGVGVDAKRHIAVSFVNDLPTVVRLVPRKDFDPDNRPEDMGWSRMEGTPYIMQRDVFTSFIGLPCTKPPWGRLVAMDLQQRKILWESEFGTIRDLAPSLVPNLKYGMPGMGGPLLTKSGLIFLGAIAEHSFRAISTTTGEVLWQTDLPFGGMAAPMTYEIDGDQYVVIAAGGHSEISPQTGDALVAFRLK